MRPWATIGISKAADAEEIARLQRLTAALAPPIRQAFLDAVQRIVDRLDISQLANLIERGAVEEALRMVAEASQAAGLAGVASSTSHAAIVAAQAAVPRIKSFEGLAAVDIRFDVLNPRTIEGLRAYEFRKIRELSDQQRLAVKAAIEAGIEAGQNPLTIARDVRGSIGLTEYQTGIVSNYRANLQNLHVEDPKARAAARSGARHRKLRDKRYQKTLERAIREEKPLTQTQIDNMVARYQERWLKYRSETISRTEATRANSRGNWMAWQQAVFEGVMREDEVRRQWGYSHDAKTRHAHRSIPGMNKNGVGLNEPFKSPLGDILYPGDPAADVANVANCRCYQIIRYVPSSR